MGNTIMVHKQPIGPPKSVGGHAEGAVDAGVVAVIVVGYLVSFPSVGLLPFELFLFQNLLLVSCRRHFLCESFLMNAVLHFFFALFFIPITPSSLFGSFAFLLGR